MNHLRIWNGVELEYFEGVVAVFASRYCIKL